jgi:hypothetical protein
MADTKGADKQEFAPRIGLREPRNKQSRNLGLNLRLTKAKTGGDQSALLSKRPKDRVALMRERGSVNQRFIKHLGFALRFV